MPFRRWLRTLILLALQVAPLLTKYACMFEIFGHFNLIIVNLG